MVTVSWDGNRLATWSFLQVSVVCQQGAGVGFVQFSWTSGALSHWVGREHSSQLLFPPYPAGFFAPVQTPPAHTGVAVTLR